ncbi:TetR/AcrR family transcriptional regulator [Nocardia heshunensis]
MTSGQQPRRTYNSERRRESALRTRASVLLACRELLFRDGFHTMTIRGVAEGAGVSAETVYKTFGSKTSMVKALWDVTLAGDDEPVPMADRPQTQQIRSTTDPREKLRLYAALVRGIHERVAQLWTVLTQAGSEIAEVLETAERERFTAVTAFVAHLGKADVLVRGADPETMTDALWALTGPQLYTQLTIGRSWSPRRYEEWLAATLIATLLKP